MGIQKSDNVNIIGREYLTEETFLDRIHDHKSFEFIIINYGVLLETIFSIHAFY